jgi:hypothetical protein
MTYKWVPSLALCIVVAAAAGSSAVAQSASARFVSFDEFHGDLLNADSSSYLNHADARVADAASFEEMRQHLATLYADIDVRHSYELDGDIYDCVPVEQQPSVRLLGIKNIAEPPPVTAVEAAGRILPAEQIDDAQAVDRFGNSIECADNTIPMRRITLEEITRFPSLRAFLSKSPDETGPPLPGRDDPCTGGRCPHKYSFTFQYVSNQGGHSALNLWSPDVNTKIGEVFSLSQQWYVAGSGSGTQTVEVGWQNYPAKYGSNSSHLFIFHTPDDYATGCYNLDCAGFVQVSKSVHLGGGFTNYSKSGGAQYEFAMTVEHYKGNWWMIYGSTAFGYYPDSLYGKGPMTKAAAIVEYGTESVQTGGIYPPEGSGAWSKEGFGKAAYQRYVYHYTGSLGAVWDSLKPDVPSPSCYTITGPDYSTASGWGIYFFEGGPGGKSC